MYKNFNGNTIPTISDVNKPICTADEFNRMFEKIYDETLEELNITKNTTELDILYDSICSVDEFNSVFGK